MHYLLSPPEITLDELRNNNANFSPRAYKRVFMGTSCVERIGDLLKSYDNGIEVGSLAYVPRSPYNFIRTKALQDYSCLTQHLSGAISPITPRAFKKATGSAPGRIVRDNDILYARGGSVGEVALANDCGQATLSGHMLRLEFQDNKWYCFAFMKHPICKLQQQSQVKGSIRALDNFTINTLLDCLIPFPNQPDAERAIAYVSALMQAIVDKEKAIRQRDSAIHDTIAYELTTHQKPNAFVFQHPTLNEVRTIGRFDAAIYDREYKAVAHQIANYCGGSATPSEEGFCIIPGPSLETKLIGTRLDSDTYKPGFYALVLPTHISIYGTMNALPYIGTRKKLPLLQEGDIVFGEAGFHKGRSIVLLEGIDNCITNAHGLCARRTDGDTTKSVFFRCIFNWYRNMGLVDLMAVGGSGGHFSPQYFDYLRIPKFPDTVQATIAQLYHNPASPPAAPPTLATFVGWHREWNSALGIWELDREMKTLRRTLAAVQEDIIQGRTVTVPLPDAAPSPQTASLFDAPDA